MARYVCIFVPEFPAQTLVRLRPELRAEAVAVLEGERPFERVCSLNQAAMQQGLLCGMSRAEAEASPVRLLRRSASEELAAKGVLLSCLAASCPSIEEFSSDTAAIYVLDMKGTERLLGSMAAAMRSLRSRIVELGLSARLISSANVHASLCLARSGRATLAHTPLGQEASALGPLPLHVLNLEQDHAATLSQWGIRTLGELAELPEVELVARLGQTGQRLRLMARGEAPHHFQPRAAPFTLEEFVEFDAPVEMLNSLLFVLNPMLAQLVSRATAHALALASVTLCCTLEGDSSHIRSIKPSLPSVDRAVFLKLLQLDLEAHPPSAGVLSLRLSAEPGQSRQVQLGLFSPQLPEPMRLEVTLARIAAIVGEDRVGKAVLKDTHEHDAFRMAKFTVEPMKRQTLSCETSALLCNQPAPALRRLRPCASVKVELRHQAIHAFWYQRVRYEVQRLYGPWRFSGEWWTGLCWAVERWDFAAQGDDSLLLGVLLRNHVDRSWWLEAVYD